MARIRNGNNADTNISNASNLPKTLTKYYVANSNPTTNPHYLIEREKKKLKIVKINSIIGLILGLIGGTIWLPLGPWCGGVCSFFLMAFMIPLAIISVVCFILLVINVVMTFKYHLNDGWYILMSFLGFLFSLSLWIFL